MTFGGNDQSSHLSEQSAFKIDFYQLIKIYNDKYVFEIHNVTGNIIIPEYITINTLFPKKYFLFQL